MPQYIRGTAAAANNEVETRDLADRRRQKNDLLQTRAETSAAYNEAQNELEKFTRQVEEYRAANKIKDPTPTEREAIVTVTRSVSDIQLEGPAHGVTAIERQIAAHALALKKKKDEAMKAWNEAGKVRF